MIEIASCLQSRPWNIDVGLRVPPSLFPPRPLYQRASVQGVAHIIAYYTATLATVRLVSARESAQPSIKLAYVARQSRTNMTANVCARSANFVPEIKPGDNRVAKGLASPVECRRVIMNFTLDVAKSI